MNPASSDPPPRYPTVPEHPTMEGRVAIVTGVSRRAGIGYAVALRLAALGADLLLHHHSPHDADQPWGADDLAAVVAGVREHLLPGAHVTDVGGDLTTPGAPEDLFAMANAELGHVDVLVANHARSGGDGPLGTLDAAALDAHWAVNTRSSILLTQALVAQHDGRPGGRVALMTSGQGQGPMINEVGYAASKAALAGITPTLADALAGRGITVNTVNPGPVDTGYLSPGDRQKVSDMFPGGRIGQPDDPARLVAWLCTDEARWVTGQVISTEGGFRRWAR